MAMAAPISSLDQNFETETSKVELDSLMENIRNSNVKSFDEIIKLLHVNGLEQNSRAKLRSCMDKVLMSMSEIHSLRDILDRLRSVARTNGLRFNPLMETSRPETSTCQILGDMFSLEIVLDGRDSHYCGPNVLDVKVVQSDNKASSPQLIEIIRNGKFLELSKYLKGLIEMYPGLKDKQTNTRLYMALQSLEVDVLKISQIYHESKPDSGKLNTVMHGSVGLIAPRVAGQCTLLTYFLSPYDLVDVRTKKMITDFTEIEEDKGLKVQVRVKPWNISCNLPITPLISNNHPIDGTCMPRFAEVSQQNNSIILPACFILTLKPPIPILEHIANEIEQETDLPVFPNGSTPVSYISLLTEESETTEIHFAEHKQRYHFNFDHLKGCQVGEIPFTHPGHVVFILNLLRKQSYLNTLVGSCIRRVKEKEDEAKKEWYFEVSMGSQFNKLNITFEHPICANSTAFAEILFSSDGFSACHFHIARGDFPLCNDEVATKILQKTFSLSLMMRKVMLHSKSHPRKENRPTPYFHPHPSFHNNNNHPLPHPNTHNAPPQQQQQGYLSNKDQPVVKQTSLPSQMFSAVTTNNNNIDTQSKDSVSTQDGKKTQSPMLTQLLVDPERPQTNVQTKNHPMLMCLLKSNDQTTQQPPQQQIQNQQQQQSLIQQQQQLNYQQVQQQQQQQQQHFQQRQNSQEFMNPNYFMQQTNQMPPPPNYPTSLASKLNSQQYQQQQQSMQYQSTPSPLNLDDLNPMTPMLTSPSFNPPQPMNMTPPSESPLPSPLYSIQSPMSTPQPLHPGMTPPMMMSSAMMSPAQRKASFSRRDSRQKSLELGLEDFPFVLNNDNDSNQMDFTQQSSDLNNVMMNQHRLVSPNISLSFDSDIGLDPNELQRRSSMTRRISNQSNVMSQSPSLTNNQESQDNFPIPSPIGTITAEGFNTNMFYHMNEQSKNNEQQLNKISDMFGEDNLKSGKNLTEQPDSDPYKYDDNSVPSIKSLPENSQQRQNSMSRHQSVEELAFNTPGLVNALTKKTDKSSQSLHNLLSKGSSQRRGSQESNVASMQQSISLSGHKPLVRQNATAKSHQPKSSNQGKVNEGKGKKRAGAKEDKAAPRRRGRPPSTEKKEYNVKRKKIEPSANSTDEDQRGKIVLKFQLDKGEPVRSYLASESQVESNQQQQGNEKPAPAPSAPAPAGNLTQLPANLQSYFKNQNEMEIKKKEKKLVGNGKGSPMATVGNKPLATGASAKGGSKNLGLGVGTSNQVQRTQPTPNKASTQPTNTKSQQQTKNPQISPQSSAKSGVPLTPRMKKNSLSDVVEKLGGGRTLVQPAQLKGQQTSTGPASNRAAFALAPVTSKSSERPFDPTVKQRVSNPSQGVPQRPNVTPKNPGSRPQTEVKIPNPNKLNKSPSHSMKVGQVQNRGPAVRKESKPRPVTPQRDGKPPTSKSPPKIPNMNQLKQTLSKINESAAASTRTDKRINKSRPSSAGGNKSPGRSITPPQSRGLSTTPPLSRGYSPSVVLQKNDVSLHSLLKAKKSPSHAAELSSRPSSTSSAESNDTRLPQIIDQRLPQIVDQRLPPPRPKPQQDVAKKSEAEVKVTVRQVTPELPSNKQNIPDTPQSPDDQLIIDDDSVKTSEVKRPQVGKTNEPPPAPFSMPAPFNPPVSDPIREVPSPKKEWEQYSPYDELMDQAVS